MEAGETGAIGPPVQPVVLAAISRPHGLAGELGIRRFNEDSDGLRVGRQVWVDGASLAGSWMKVTGLRGDYLRLEGILDRTKAETLRGAQLSVDRSSLPETAAGEFYLHDLLGFEVVDAAGRKLGVLEGLQVSGTKEYFVIKGAREVLLPADAPVLDRVDLAAATMHLNMEIETEEELDRHSRSGSKG